MYTSFGIFTFTGEMFLEHGISSPLQLFFNCCMVHIPTLHMRSKSSLFLKHCGVGHSENYTAP